MKKLILSAAILVAALGVNAQMKKTDGDEGGGAYVKGQSSISLGYGFISPYKTLFKFSNYYSGGSSSYNAQGPFGFIYEYGAAEHISVGLELAYGQITNKNTYAGENSNGGDLVETDKLTQFSAIARGNYHFGHSAKFDPYVGLGLGYGNFKYKTTSNDPNDINYSAISIPTSFGITAQLGAKYYFSKNVGIYAELGYLAGSFAQVGVSFKF